MLPIFQRTVTNSSGDVLPGASVEVRRESDNALVQLYADRAGTVLLPNPTTADSDGFVQFFAASSNYKITATSGAGTVVWRYVDIGSADVRTDLSAPTGAAMVGANAYQTQADVNAEKIHVKAYGAKGDGVTDDADAINTADAIAGALGKVLEFDGGDYIVKKPVQLLAPWKGVPRKTRIVVGSGFSFPAPTFDPRNYSAITNKNCAAAYNPATADAVFIDGVDFLNNAANVVQILALANVRGGEISNCHFTTGTSAVCNPLDLFASVKNLTVRGCEIRNLTQNAVGGGCMWVRNITSNGALSQNDTENIRVVDCYFEQTSLDEAFAVYGVNGMTKNVRVTRCTFNGNVASTQRHGNLVTAFPLGNTANAGVQDVVFSECRFESNNFTNGIFRAGQTADASRVCKDIRLDNCYFKASQPAAGTAAIVRNIPCVGGNVTMTNCTIDTTGTANTPTYGVQQFDAVTNTTVTGTMTYGFGYCQIVQGSIAASLTGTGAFNCRLVKDCTLSASAGGVLANESNRYDVLNNRITVTGATGTLYGVNYNSVASSTPYGEVADNKIDLNNASAFAVRASGTNSGLVRVINNRVEGTGKTITGTQLKEVQGNNWYGTLDSMRATAYVDYDHNYATPIGTFAAALTHTESTNSWLLGFIKTANAGNSSDWKTVFSAKAAS